MNVGAMHRTCRVASRTVSQGLKTTYPLPRNYSRFSNRSNSYPRQWRQSGTLADSLAYYAPQIKDYMRSVTLSPSERKSADRLSEMMTKQHPSLDITRYPDHHLDSTNFGLFRESDLSSFHLTKDQWAFFNDNGVLGPLKINALTPSIIQRLLNLEASQTKGTLKVGNKINKKSVLNTFLWTQSEVLKLAMHPEIVSKVASILGPNIMTIGASFFVVPPAKESENKVQTHPVFQSPHSDIVGNICSLFDPDQPVTRSHKDIVNVWINLTGSGDGFAPLTLFPGTHHHPVITPMTYFHHFYQQGEGDKVAKVFSMDDVLQRVIGFHGLHMDYLSDVYSPSYLSNIPRFNVETQPGEALIFKSHGLHGSGPNMTDQPRVTLNLRFDSADTEKTRYHFMPMVTDFLRDFYSPDQLRYLFSGAGSPDTPGLLVRGQSSHPSVWAVDPFKLLDIMKQNGY